MCPRKSAPGVCVPIFLSLPSCTHTRVSTRACRAEPCCSRGLLCLGAVQFSLLSHATSESGKAAGTIRECMHYGGYGGYICFLNGGPVSRKPGLLLPVCHAVTVSKCMCVRDAGCTQCGLASSSVNAFHAPSMSHRGIFNKTHLLSSRLPVCLVASLSLSLCLSVSVSVSVYLSLSLSVSLFDSHD